MCSQQGGVATGRGENGAPRPQDGCAVVHGGADDMIFRMAPEWDCMETFHVITSWAATASLRVNFENTEGDFKWQSRRLVERRLAQLFAD
jgi:hypothetical protein